MLLGTFFILALINICFSAYFVSKLKNKYPKVYQKYDRPDGVLISQKNAFFFGEFVIGGMYKHYLEKNDYKYIFILRCIAGLTLLVFIVYFISIFI